MVILCRDGLAAAVIFPYPDQLVWEVHAAPAGQKFSPVFCPDNGERRIEVVPLVFPCDAYNVLSVSLVNGLETLREGIEVNPFPVGAPYGACRIVLEVSREVSDVQDFRHAIIDIVQIGHHQPGLVGLIAVPFHADPCYAAAVRTPDRVGVIASAHRDDLAFSVPDIVDIDFRVRAESVLPARFLAAGIGDEPSVRAPVQLLDSAERLGWELMDFLLAGENVNA